MRLDDDWMMTLALHCGSSGTVGKFSAVRVQYVITVKLLLRTP